MSTVLLHTPFILPTQFWQIDYNSLTIDTPPPQKKKLYQV